MKKVLALVLFLVLSAVSCGNPYDYSFDYDDDPPGYTPAPPAEHNIVYRVTGTAATVDVTYENESGGTSQEADVSLPWEYSFTVYGSIYTFLYISAQNNGSSGNVTAEILENDDVIETATSSGAYVIATASTSIGSF